MWHCAGCGASWLEPIADTLEAERSQPQERRR
jgi:hypothetical protein